MSTEFLNTEANIINEALDSIASVIITDKKGHFLYVNDLFCEMMEYTREELIGRRGNIFKSGVHTKEYYKEFWSLINSGEAWRGVFCNRTKTGELIWVDTVVKPIFNEDKKIEKFVGIHLNVTESIQNKFAMKAQEKQLIEVSKFATLGEISGFIAHEIKNPMTYMSLAISSLELELNSELPNIEKIKKLNNKMKEVSTKINEIVSALGGFSRNETAANMGFQKIKELLDDVVLISEYIAKSDDVKLIIESNVDNELLIKCYKTQISQVLINLIKNSCHAVRSLEKREVRLKLDLNADSLEIRVIDTGLRIPDEVYANLFTPYFTTKKAGEGTGIGLSLSAKIIEAHGGKLYLDRECEQTCFVVIIPIMH